MNIPSCPPWCDSYTQPHHWSPIANGMEAIHTRHIGPIIVKVSVEASEDGSLDTSAPVVVITDPSNAWRTEGEAVLSAYDSTILSADLFAASRFAEDLETGRIM